MSGHSKWSTIKHKKGAEDKRRGQLFTKLSRAIIVAAKDGGPDPAGNAALATAIAKARSYSMPKDNIERAIQRATGSGDGADAYEAITYEGYGPDGVAIIVEALTDNRNRTAADVRSIFGKHGASLGTPGSVAWQFDRTGVILLPAKGLGEDDAVLAAADAGAESVELDGDSWQVTTDPGELAAVRDALEAAGLAISSAELTLLPRNTVELDEAAARRVLRLVDTLEEHDDVQEVFANFDIPDAVLEAVAG
ncbi:MAG TPA: YebC/PmpR family DNA-binding transcriptional regulator [Gaiellales bacterium]|nr:YebC/PmpR family DNA-binding transcriptional regulator [Gaiellales bacterium]